MTEENNGATTSKWRRIFRKKWFFPAVYLTVAAILLTAVIWYQNVDNQIPDTADNEESVDNYIPEPHDDEDAQAVMGQQEDIQMPVKNEEEAEIVTKFYDYNADEEDKQDALVFHNNRYYQSTGIDITSGDDEAFDVVASLSGTVEEVKEDPLLGDVVSISHANDVKTFYASMGDIDVEPGAEVSQGDTLGKAGENLFGKEHGNHLHFELQKEGNALNPEELFNQPLNELDDMVSEDESEEDNESGSKEDDEDVQDMPDAGSGNDNNEEDAPGEDMEDGKPENAPDMEDDPDKEEGTDSMEDDQ